MTARSLEYYYKINGDTLERAYKDHLSGYMQWEDKSHADKYLVFPENFGPQMSIDETSTKDGELFTILSNKEGHGRKGSIAAIISGTKVEDVVAALKLVPEVVRKQVGVITMDFSSSMAAIAESGDPNEAYKAAFTIGSYVKEYGFDIDFAPVADVNTNPENIVIGPRAFSDDPETAADFVVSYLNGLDSANVIGTLKHFPGHGDTLADTHLGYAFTQKDWAGIAACRNEQDLERNAQVRNDSFQGGNQGRCADDHDGSHSCTQGDGQRLALHAFSRDFAR